VALMRNESTPVVITRGQVGQWASIIGGTSLLIGIIGFIWQGGFTAPILVALGVGAVGMVLWAYATPTEFRNFVSGRQARNSTVAVFATLLMVGIVALAYIVLQRAVITLDMTSDTRFTISQATRDVLSRVQRPIRITGFYSSRSLPVRELDDQFFRLYEVESKGLISRQYIDPDEQPTLAATYGAQDGSVFISYLNPDGSVDFQSLALIPRGYNQENDVTEAISRLLIAGTVKVYFEVGHGELDANAGDTQGLSRIHGGIQESGLVTAPFNLIDLADKNGSIPQDATAVILARPLTDFSTREIGILDAYLKRGGGLFILSDPLLKDNAFLRENSAFNQYLWTTYGIRGLDAVVVDPASNNGQSQLTIASASVFGVTDIGARLSQQDAPTLFNVARALEVSDAPPANIGNGRVIMSSDQSYGETDIKSLLETNTYRYDDGNDLRGPLTTVAWAYNNTNNSKIVLVGDSDFITNGYILNGGNSLLFTDSLAWLTGYTDRINFGGKAFSSVPLMFMTGQTLDVIAFVTVILLPGLVLVIGLAVWTRRVRR
jgi:hypothetical protein